MMGRHGRGDPEVHGAPSAIHVPSQIIPCALQKFQIAELHGFCASQEARQPARMDDGTKAVMQVAAVGPHRAMQGMGGVQKSRAVPTPDRLSRVQLSLTANISKNRGSTTMERTPYRFVLAKIELQRQLQAKGLSRAEALRVIARMPLEERWERLSLTQRGMILWECRNRD